MRIEKLAKEENVAIKWTHFPLHPDTPTDGLTLEQLFAGRGMDIPKVQEEMRKRMEAEGLPYGTRTHTYNSRLAQELGKWATSLDKGDAYHDAVFRKYFVDTENVGDVDVLVGIAKAVGLPEADAREVLEKRTFKDAIDEDWKRSHGMGVTGVPTFVAAGHGLVGAQPYEALVSLVQHAREQATD